MTHSPEQLNMVLVDFKGGATFAGMSEHAARLRGDHQPRPGAHPRRPHAGRPVRRDGAPPGAAARGRQLRLDPRLREGPRRRRGPRAAAVAVHRGRRVLRDARRPSRSSSTCSSRSAGSAARSACTCCSPRSGSRRAGCAASSRTCPTGSACAPSRAGESRAVLGVPDAYELPPVPGLGYLKPDQSTLLRFKAAYVSGPPSRPGAGTPRRGRPRCSGILPFTISEVQTLEPLSRAPSPSRRPSPAQGEQESLLDVAVDRMVGHGPPAHQVWLPPLDVPDTLDQLMPDLAEDPRARPGLAAVARASAGSSSRSAPSTARASSAATPSRSTSAGASRPRRRRRRAAQRQEHAAAHDRHQPVADDDAAGVAVLRARLRRRHVRAAGRAARTSPASAPASEPDVVRRIVAEVQGVVDRREAYFRAQGIDSIETYRTPAGRRAGPTTGTATCSSSSTAGARCAPTSTTSRWSSSSSPPAA